MRDQLHCVSNVSHPGVVSFRKHISDVREDENINWSLNVFNPTLAFEGLAKELKARNVARNGERFQIDASAARKIAVKTGIHKLRPAIPKYRSFTDETYEGFPKMLGAALVLSIISSQALRFSLGQTLWVVVGCLVLVTVAFTVARHRRIQKARNFIT